MSNGTDQSDSDDASVDEEEESEVVSLLPLPRQTAHIFSE